MFESIQGWDTLGLVAGRIGKKCSVQSESFPGESQYKIPRLIIQGSSQKVESYIFASKLSRKKFYHEATFSARLTFYILEIEGRHLNSDNKVFSTYWTGVHFLPCLQKVKTKIIKRLTKQATPNWHGICAKKSSNSLNSYPSLTKYSSLNTTLMLSQVLNKWVFLLLLNWFSRT